MRACKWTVPQHRVPRAAPPPCAAVRPAPPWPARTRLQAAQTLALLHWQLVPAARAKAKRLGRELSVKVELGGSCSLLLFPSAAGAADTLTAASFSAAAAAADGANGAGGGRGSSAGGGDREAGGGGGLMTGGEEYAIQLPALVLLDPLTQEECPVTYKGVFGTGVCFLKCPEHVLGHGGTGGTAWEWCRHTMPECSNNVGAFFISGIIKDWLCAFSVRGASLSYD